MKLTEWFGPGVEPTIPGVYERTYSPKEKSGSFYFWNGRFWEHGGCNSPEFVRRNDMESINHYGFWRGLAEKP